MKIIILLTAFVAESFIALVIRMAIILFAIVILCQLAGCGLTAKNNNVKVVHVINKEQLSNGRMNVTFVHKTDTTVLKGITQREFDKRFARIYKSF